jgi:LmbE family N-acetylglucosaminyl deacetylase
VSALLAVLAHPDDETTFGGTLARCAAEGVDVTIVCATGGGGGGGPDENPAAIIATRQVELEAAARVLGAARVVHLERTWGALPCLRRGNYHLVARDHERAVERLVRDLRPDVVLTFGNDGVTGHETHVAVGALTRRAVAASGLTPRLLEVAYGPAQVAGVMAWIDAHPDCLAEYQEAQLRNPSIGPPVPEFVVVPEEAITTVVDVTAFLDVKRRAAACHLSQGGGGGILDAFSAPTAEAFVLAGAAPGTREDHVMPR